MKQISNHLSTLQLMLLGTFILLCSSAFSQHLEINSGKVVFQSQAPLEDIEARSSTAYARFNPRSGIAEASILIKTFQFEKALMQQHFNDFYLESDKFPTAKFEGYVGNIGAVVFNRDGTYPIIIEGNMTIRGITESISGQGVLILKNKQLQIKADFAIRLRDYAIPIPELVVENIAETVTVFVDFTFPRS